MAITNKQARFIAEYLVDFNATQAAIRAGYSRRSARKQGSRLRTNADISAIIAERMMSVDEVLARTTDIARGDIADLMDITPTGFNFRLIDVDENGERVINPNTKLIKKIRQKVTTILAKKEDGEDREIVETELELHDAQSALVTLGKHHKLFADRTEFTGKDGGEMVVRIVHEYKGI